MSSFSGGHLQDGDEDADVRENYDNTCDPKDGPRGEGRERKERKEVKKKQIR